MKSPTKPTCYLCGFNPLIWETSLCLCAGCYNYHTLGLTTNDDCRMVALEQRMYWPSIVRIDDLMAQSDGPIA